jgi:hypothetical protein
VNQTIFTKEGYDEKERDMGKPDYGRTYGFFLKTGIG